MILNPLNAQLRRLGRRQNDLYLASERLLERSRLSVLCRDLPEGPGAPKPVIPREETREMINKALLCLGGERITDEEWDAFAMALRAMMAPHDRRTNGKGARSKPVPRRRKKLAAS